PLCEAILENGTYAKPYTLSNGQVKECWYWEATWPDESHQSVSVRFSVNEYGEDIARQMAIRARRKGLESVSGIFWASARGEVEADVKPSDSIAYEEPTQQKNISATIGLPANKTQQNKVFQ
ncbi:MAG: hypothetical protein AAF512_25010, partial [Pseudomonadota bacterium]